MYLLNKFNNLQVSITTPGGISAGADTFTVNSLPANIEAPFLLTRVLQDGTAGEIIRVGAVNGLTLSQIERAQENTVATLHEEGASFECRPTAKTFAQLKPLYVSPQMAEIATDGSDVSAKFQSLINYCKDSKVPLRNGDGSAVFGLGSPLYISGDIDIDLANAELKKLNNTVGVGSNLSRGGTVTDSYAVDAHIIVTHPDNLDTPNLHMRNIRFTSALDGAVYANWHDYGIFAPRLYHSSLENLRAQGYRFKRFIAGYRWWIISKLDHIRSDGGEATFEIMNDGSNNGGSTSINGRMIVGTDMQHLIKLYGVSYSVFDTPALDYGKNYAFHFTLCPSIVLNAPSTELLQVPKFLYASGSRITVNALRCAASVGTSSSEQQLISLLSGSRVILAGGVIGNFTGGTANLNRVFSITNNSLLVKNLTVLPTNGNLTPTLTGGGKLLNIDENGFNVVQ